MNPLTSEILAGQRAPEDTDAPSDSPGDAGLDAVAEQTITTTDSRTDDTHAVPFRDLGVSDTICLALEGAGIYTTFPIQALALPIALGGYDIIGQARTGTGKTLGFGIPLLQRLAEGEPAGPKSPHALVVAPTRELASQIADDLRMAGSGLGTRVLTLYGGRAYEPQIEALRAGVDVVVSTPGRLLDLVGQRHLELSHVQMLVLDEADKMLDLGFLPDVERILQLTPDDRQTMMFSATMPGEVVTLARRHLRRPTHVRAETIDASAAVPTTRQFVFRTHQMDKIEVLARLLQAEGRGLTMVFTQTKRAADQVAGSLKTRGFAVAAVHGDLGQGQREQALRAFRHRRGRPRARCRRRHARGQLRVPRRRQGLPAPHRPDRPRGQGRGRGHVRRLARHAALEADRHRAEPEQGRTGRDVLHVRALVHRAGHPARGDRHAASGAAKPGRAGCRGGGGHRRDRRPDPTRPWRWRWR
jgi:hypothetical protein